MRVLTLPGVFKPRSDSWMLAARVARAPLPAGARVLELCTGSGIAAVAAARRGCDVTAVDVSRRAVLTAAANARLNGTPDPRRGEVRERRRGPLGPLLADRTEELAAKGLLPDGKPEEDVLVISGRRPAG